MKRIDLKRLSRDQAQRNSRLCRYLRERRYTEAEQLAHVMLDDADELRAMLWSKEVITDD